MRGDEREVNIVVGWDVDGRVRLREGSDGQPFFSGVFTTMDDDDRDELTEVFLRARRLTA